MLYPEIDVVYSGFIRSFSLPYCTIEMILQCGLHNGCFLKDILFLKDFVCHYMLYSSTVSYFVGMKSFDLGNLEM